MERIRIMEAKIGTVYAMVNVPFNDTTFLPQHMFGFQGDIYTAEETARVLKAESRTEKECKDYARYEKVLKWAKTCNGKLRTVSLQNDEDGKYVQVELAFYDVDSLVSFNKDFRLCTRC